MEFVKLFNRNVRCYRCRVRKITKNEVYNVIQLKFAMRESSEQSSINKIYQLLSFHKNWVGVNLFQGWRFHYGEILICLTISNFSKIIVTW